MLRLLEDKSPKQGLCLLAWAGPQRWAGRPPSQSLECKVHYVLPDDNKQEYRKGFEVQLNVKNGIEKPDKKQTR